MALSHPGLHPSQKATVSYLSITREPLPTPCLHTSQRLQMPAFDGSRSTSQTQDGSLRPGDERGLLLIKLTPYRITVVIISLGFILAKGITAYRHLGSVSMALDVVFGLLSLELWWIGLYEPVNQSVWRWWFHTDHSTRMLDMVVSILAFGAMYGATIFSWYLNVWISQHYKILGFRRVVISTTTCAAVVVPIGTLSLFLLRSCAKRRLRYDSRAVSRCHVIWGCSAVLALALGITTIFSIRQYYLV